MFTLSSMLLAPMILTIILSLTIMAIESFIAKEYSYGSLCTITTIIISVVAAPLFVAGTVIMFTSVTTAVVTTLLLSAVSMYFGYMGYKAAKNVAQTPVVKEQVTKLVTLTKDSFSFAKGLATRLFTKKTPATVVGPERAPQKNDTQSSNPPSDPVIA